MSGRILIILSIIIIVISATGLFLNTKTAPNSNSNSDTIKLSTQVIVVKKEIKKGQVIKADSLALENKNISLDYKKDPIILDKSIEYASGMIALKSIPVGSILRYDDIAAPQAKANDSAEIQIQGNLPFEFALSSREFNLIKDIKNGDRVDVYFGYEKKTKNKDDGIINKNDGSGYQNKENANLVDFVLFLKDKRVLNINQKESVITSKNGKGQIPIKGFITIELKPSEIKSIYTVENLGYFYFFPADDEAKSKFSTKNTLSKDFVKELRGGDN